LRAVKRGNPVEQKLLETHLRAQITNEHRIWLSLDAIFQGTETEELLLEDIDLSGLVHGTRNKGGAIVEEGKGVSSKREGQPFRPRDLLFAVVGTTQMVRVSNKYHADHRAPACGSA
jgi:hypothetical protein